MKTIKNNIENEIIIKNSKFITYLYKIDNSNVNDYLNNIKKIHPKATHHTYAYIYNNIKKVSDDNEPTNTAGKPMLNVLEKENLNNILCITIRYFGGIKLGAGGLIRAYTKSVTEALKKADYIYLEEGYKIRIEFDYNLEKQINYILNEKNILEKQFNNKIIYIATISKENIKNLPIEYEILENILIKKDS
ncbi:MAG: YigZ family protein [Bacilli bacterium]|nr:YigZ family protein [Bacilli bacterium]